MPEHIAARPSPLRGGGQASCCVANLPKKKEKKMKRVAGNSIVRFSICREIRDIGTRPGGYSLLYVTTMGNFLTVTDRHLAWAINVTIFIHGRALPIRLDPVAIASDRDGKSRPLSPAYSLWLVI